MVGDPLGYAGASFGIGQAGGLYGKVSALAFVQKLLGRSSFVVEPEGGCQMSGVIVVAFAEAHPIASGGIPVFSQHVFGNGFLDILAARFRQSGKRTADVSDFCLPEHQGLVHPLARAVELDESSMVDHPVDHRGGKLVVAQDRSPFAELDVGGEHHASLLVAC